MDSHLASARATHRIFGADREERNQSLLKKRYISSCAPSSTTRFGGMLKYSVAVLEFRDMKM
jgi:hypothetical protein